jgi:ABC-type transport system involved in cytochrome bd biosynthesis fused ATPase/permease subunit
MNQRRRIFFIVFGVYHLIILIFTIVVEKADLGFLIDLYGKIWLMRWGAILGLGLFSADVVWTWLESRNTTKEKDAMRHENNTLKAKVYDFQQAAKEPVKQPGEGSNTNL